MKVLEEAVLGLRTLGDRGGLAQALVDLGDACAQADAVERAVKAWDEARAIFEGAGDVANELPVLIALGRARGPGPQRDDAKALEVLTRALKLASELGDAEAEATAASRLGNLHALRAEKAEARAMYERELALRERLGDERALAAALIDAGQRFVRGLMRDEQVAAPWLERGRVLAEKAGEPRWVVNALLHGADLALELARPAEAVAAYERALAASKAAGLPETAAAAHLGIGNARLQQRDATGALAAYELALAGFEQTGNRHGQAVALEQSAKAHALRPAHAQAVAAYQRAIEIAKPTGDAVFLAGLLRGLGGVQLGFGDAQKALAALEYALKLSDSRDDRVGASSTLLMLGVAYRQLGRFVLALDATERARALQLRLGDRRGAAMTLCNLGVVYWDLGQIEKALGMYERALVDLEAVQDRDSIATTLGNLGATHERLGDPEHALEQHARALAIWEALKDQGGAGRVRIAMAMCHVATGALDRALELAERGLADLEAAGDKRGAVSAQVVLGKVLEQRGATAKALQAFERAARGAEKLGATAIQVEALGELAATRLRAGDAGRAVSEAHRAVELMKTLVGGLGEEQSSSVRGEYTGLFSTGLRAAARVGDVAEAAFFLESGRAGALLDALQVRDSQRWAGVPEALRQAEAEARADEARALAAWSKASDGDDRAILRAVRADLDAARAKVAQAVERIQREAKQASRLAYPVATPVEDLQALLGDGEALVLYGLAKGDDPAHGLVLTRDDARIVELGKTSAIVEACEALHTDDPSSDPAPALERLRALLVAPLALAEGTRRLLVGPDGALGYVPFAALIADLELAYVASGSTYGVLREDTDPGTKVLALGDPDYQVKFDPTALGLYAPVQRTGSAPIVRGGRLPPLPGTRAEATAVGDVTLLGKDASEGKLVEAVLQARGTLARDPLRLPRPRGSRPPVALVARAHARRRQRRLPHGARGAADGPARRPRGPFGLRDRPRQGRERRGHRGPHARVHVRRLPERALLALEGRRRGHGRAHEAVLRALEPEGRLAGQVARRRAPRGAGLRARATPLEAPLLLGRLGPLGPADVAPVASLPRMLAPTPPLDGPHSGGADARPARGPSAAHRASRTPPPWRSDPDVGPRPARRGVASLQLHRRGPVGARSGGRGCPIAAVGGSWSCWRSRGPPVKQAWSATPSSPRVVARYAATSPAPQAVGRPEGTRRGDRAALLEPPTRWESGALRRRLVPLPYVRRADSRRASRPLADRREVSMSSTRWRRVERPRFGPASRNGDRPTVRRGVGKSGGIASEGRSPTRASPDGGAIAPRRFG